jgi:hypothetical protein
VCEALYLDVVLLKGAMLATLNAKLARARAARKWIM